MDFFLFYLPEQWLVHSLGTISDEVKILDFMSHRHKKGEYSTIWYFVRDHIHRYFYDS